MAHIPVPVPMSTAFWKKRGTVSTATATQSRRGLLTYLDSLVQRRQMQFAPNHHRQDVVTVCVNQPLHQGRGQYTTNLMSNASWALESTGPLAATVSTWPVVVIVTDWT